MWTETQTHPHIILSMHHSLTLGAHTHQPMPMGFGWVWVQYYCSWVDMVVILLFMGGHGWAWVQFEKKMSGSGMHMFNGMGNKYGSLYLACIVPLNKLSASNPALHLWFPRWVVLWFRKAK